MREGTRGHGKALTAPTCHDCARHVYVCGSTVQQAAHELSQGRAASSTEQATPVCSPAPGATCWTCTVFY